MKYDVVIIGSGLGGLECGYILAKHGYNVCVLEQNPQIGGCLQTFRRGGAMFDTGFHYVGGLEEGQFLHKLFRYFDLLDLPWHRLDENGFAEVILNDTSYFFASGYARFAETLAKDFPRQRAQLEKYAAFLQQVGDNIGRSFTLAGEQHAFSAHSLFGRSAHLFLQETIDDPLLRQVLSGASLTMELCPEKLPLYVFAQINSSFIQSAWRLRGGGAQIAEQLAAGIRRMGGTILTKAKATRLVTKDRGIDAVEYNGAEQLQARYVISGLHPARTLALLDEQAVRTTYRTRINSLPNTFGMFTVHLQLKENTVPYLNRAIYLYREPDVWNYSRYRPQAKTTAALINCQTPRAGEAYTANIDILSPMHWEAVAQWSNTAVGNRGEAYRCFKQQKAEECIALAAEKIPNLKQCIKKVYTSTPLTYRDYTGTQNGAAYGIQKDFADTIQTILPPQTPIPNLLLTGQNLNLHGILGVSMTSFFTCARIVGMENLLNELGIG